MQLQSSVVLNSVHILSFRNPLYSQYCLSLSVTPSPYLGEKGFKGCLFYNKKYLFFKISMHKKSDHYYWCEQECKLDSIIIKIQTEIRIALFFRLEYSNVITLTKILLNFLLSFKNWLNYRILVYWFYHSC